MKVAFTGASGSGKTTLVKFVEDEFGLTHFSGSAGDVLNELDKEHIFRMWGVRTDGHQSVIKESAKNLDYGYFYQAALQLRRQTIIELNDNFVTDRSPLDNFTYFMSQVGYQLSDGQCNHFLFNCKKAMAKLTHLIYIRSVQPQELGVENNGSRIPNWFWQQAMDAQFHHWLMREFFPGSAPLRILIIDYWDLDKRKQAITEFLNS